MLDKSRLTVEGEATLKKVIRLITQTFSEWNEDNASRLAAALAYYTIFSVAPLLTLIVGITGLITERAYIQARMVREIGNLVGPQGAAAVEMILENVDDPGTGLFSIVISVVILLIGASGVFEQLHAIMNEIWDVPPANKKRKLINEIVLKRLFSFALVVATGFLLLVSLVVSAGLAALDEWMMARLPGFIILARVINLVVSLGIVTVLFAALFKWVPDQRIRWRDVWLGAFITAVLFSIGKFAIGLYLGNSGLASVYGAAGSIIALLVWVYYTAQIVFIGAEFTQVYTKMQNA
jgi:membrane protein